MLQSVIETMQIRCHSSSATSQSMTVSTVVITAVNSSNSMSQLRMPQEIPRQFNKTSVSHSRRMLTFCLDVNETTLLAVF